SDDVYQEFASARLAIPSSPLHRMLAEISSPRGLDTNLAIVGYMGRGFWMARCHALGPPRGRLMGPPVRSGQRPRRTNTSTASCRTVVERAPPEEAAAHRAQHRLGREVGEQLEGRDVSIHPADGGRIGARPRPCR